MSLVSISVAQKNGSGFAGVAAHGCRLSGAFDTSGFNTAAPPALPALPPARSGAGSPAPASRGQTSRTSRSCAGPAPGQRWQSSPPRTDRWPGSFGQWPEGGQSRRPALRAATWGDSRARASTRVVQQPAMAKRFEEGQAGGQSRGSASWTPSMPRETRRKSRGGEWGRGNPDAPHGRCRATSTPGGGAWRLCGGGQTGRRAGEGGQTGGQTPGQTPRTRPGRARAAAPAAPHARQPVSTAQADNGTAGTGRKRRERQDRAAATAREAAQRVSRVSAEQRRSQSRAPATARSSRAVAAVRPVRRPLGVGQGRRRRGRSWTGPQRAHRRKKHDAAAVAALRPSPHEEGPTEHAGADYGKAVPGQTQTDHQQTDSRRTANDTDDSDGSDGKPQALLRFFWG
jgi:hypothetical protein